MPYKVVYEYNGEKDELFFCGECTDEEIKRRIQKLRAGGFKVLKHYHVKSILTKEEKQMKGSIY